MLMLWSGHSLLVILMVSWVRSECLSKDCHGHVYFEMCPEDSGNSLADTEPVRDSYSACAIRCQTVSDCSAFTLRQDGDNLSCELSTETASCSGHSPQPGSRTYVKHSFEQDSTCSLPPRVALKTTRPVCPSGYTGSPTSGTCLKLSTYTADWNSARSSCIGEGADLVKILDAATDQLVSDMFDGIASFVWTGGHKVQTNGDFYWLDDTTMAVYKNWDWGEPSNDWETYVETYSPPRWKVESSSYNSHFICEVAQTPGYLSIVQGSTAALRDAVLGGAKLSVAIESVDNSGVFLYAIDSVEINGDSLTAHAYTFDGNLHLTHVRVGTSGTVDWFVSGGSDMQGTAYTITWVVHDAVSNCYLDDTSSYLGVPALTVKENQIFLDSVEYSDLKTVLSNTFAGIQSVRYLSDQTALNFRLVSFLFTDESLKGTVTWLPSADHYNVQNMDYDLSRSPLELSGQLDTSSWTFSGALTSDQNLDEINFFVDACWTLEYTYVSDGSSEGDVDVLFTNIRAGMNVGMHFSNATHSIFMEAENVRCFKNHNDVLSVWSKSGLTNDHGETWFSGRYMDNIFTIGGVQPPGSYSVAMYTNGRERSARYSLVNGVVIDGSFEDVKSRIAAGLMPRVMIETDNLWQVYLDIESAVVASDGSGVTLKSYRTPDYGAVVCQLEVPSGNFQATSFRPSTFGDVYALPDSGTYSTFTLFFENF